MDEEKKNLIVTSKAGSGEIMRREILITDNIPKGFFSYKQHRALLSPEFLQTHVKWLPSCFLIAHQTPPIA